LREFFLLLSRGEVFAPQIFEHEDDDDYEFFERSSPTAQKSTAPTPLLEVGAAQLHRQTPPGALTRSRSAKV
jgi:hypothetical protein